MQIHFKNYTRSFIHWCSAHHQKLAIVLGLLAIGIAVTYAFRLFPIWQVWLAIWIIAVLTPLILGMLGKVQFKWAILWECVMFFPIVLILALFIQDIRNYLIKNRGV